MLLIRTHLGSITDSGVGAHAVVNASNPEVALGSGVSGAIRTACGGAAFQKEVRERLMEEFGGSLEPDDCLVTSAGCATSFRWVLHVAAVNYRKADPETGGVSGPLRIETCFRAALDAAESVASQEGLQGSFVLATPLLGAGHGGRHGKEVHGHDDIAVIAQERSSELAGLLARIQAPEITRDSAFRDGESEFQKLAVNPRSAPACILLYDPSDEGSNFSIDLGPAKIFGA